MLLPLKLAPITHPSETLFATIVVLIKWNDYGVSQIIFYAAILCKGIKDIFLGLLIMGKINDQI